MSMNRRQFIAATGAACAATTLPVSASSAEKALAPVIHNVYFWLKNPDSASDKAKLIAGLQSLAVIPQIKALHVGVPASTEQRDVIDSSYQVSELMLFDTVEDQDNYQTHPVHQKFVEECAHLWRKVVVYDSVKA